MITDRPERLKTFDYIGLHQYFLTFCTYERRQIFAEPEHVAVVRTQIQRAAADLRFAVLAYCYMPDHVHLLVEGLADDSDGRQFISRAKQYSGFHYRAAFGTSSRTRCAPGWSRMSAPIHFPAPIPTQSRRFSKRYNCGADGTSPAKAGHYVEPRVRLKPDATSSHKSG
jgi:REP element-mobilizing transposase RayT